MDELDIVDELEIDIAPTRSMFLTVLCILTWVGSGLSFIYHIYVYLLAASAVNILSAVGDNKSMDWLVIQQMFGIFAPLLTVAGAILMWNLKKIGFWIYAVGQLVPVLVSIYFAIFISGKIGSGEVLFLMVLPNIIPIGFFIMYATRVQELKK